MVRWLVCVVPRESSATLLSSCVHAEGAVERLLELWVESPYHEDDVWRETGEVGDVAERSSRGGGCGGVSPSYGLGKVSMDSLLASGGRLRRT